MIRYERDERFYSITLQQFIHKFKILELFFSFADVDECADNKANECDPNAALCTNNEGSYDCSCFSGYIGDGKNCSGTLPITQSFK